MGLGVCPFFGFMAWLVDYTDAKNQKERREKSEGNRTPKAEEIW